MSSPVLPGGGGKFVAVRSGKILYSSDGKGWDAVSNISDMNTVVYGNNMFVAGGLKGKLAYSSDGVTWTAVPGHIFDLDWSGYGDITTQDVQAIVWGSDKFVAVSGWGGMFAYSSDGANWNPVVNEDLKVFYKNGLRAINGIVYGNGKFVAVSSYGKVVLSDNGVDWQVVPSGDDKLSILWDINAIAWGNDKIVAVGSRSASAYSSDGKTWTKGNLAGFSEYSENAYVAWGNGKFVAVAYDGKVATSYDGINWAVTNSNIKWETKEKKDYFTSIGFVNSKFIAGTFHGEMASSTDGTAWTLIK